MSRIVMARREDVLTDLLCRKIEAGPVLIETGGVLVRRWGRWVPDGLHVWVGAYGVHCYWSGSPYQRRVSFDREGKTS